MITALVILSILGFAVLLGAAVTTLFASPPHPAQNIAEPSFDLRAFRNLTDPEEESFLRSRLAARTFRRLQRQKYRVVLAYLRDLSLYAAAMAQIGQAGRAGGNPEVLVAADNLVASAFRLRTMAFLVAVDALLRILSPWGALSLGGVVRLHEEVVDAAARLRLARRRSQAPPAV